MRPARAGAPRRPACSRGGRSRGRTGPRRRAAASRSSGITRPRPRCAGCASTGTPPAPRISRTRSAGPARSAAGSSRRASAGCRRTPRCGRGASPRATSASAMCGRPTVAPSRRLREHVVPGDVVVLGDPRRPWPRRGCSRPSRMRSVSRDEAAFGRVEEIAEHVDARELDARARAPCPGCRSSPSAAAAAAASAQPAVESWSVSATVPRPAAAAARTSSAGRLACRRRRWNGCAGRRDPGTVAHQPC